MTTKSPAKDSVLITGCSAGGLGSAMALEFQARSLHVFATARDLSKLAHLSAIPNITLLQLDVTNAISIANAVEVVKSTGDGKLKFLVNNAGAGYTMPLLDVDVEDAQKTYDINIWGVLRVVQAFAPLLIEENGTIVNIGSSAGVVHFPFRGIYNSSKAAINHLSTTLRLELEPLDVKVITVIAGIIKSNFFANLSTSAFSLPALSQYKSMEGVLNGMVRGEGSAAAASTAESFAQDVVKDVLSGRTGNTYSGALAWSAKVIWLFPGWFMDWYARKQGQMSKFRKIEK